MSYGTFHSVLNEDIRITPLLFAIHLLHILVSGSTASVSERCLEVQNWVLRETLRVLGRDTWSRVLSDDSHIFCVVVVFGSCGVSVFFGMLGSVVDPCPSSVPEAFEFSTHLSTCLSSPEETTSQKCGTFIVICSTTVLLPIVMEKCSQSMRRFLVNSVSLLAGDNFDGPLWLASSSRWEPTLSDCNQVAIFSMDVLSDLCTSMTTNVVGCICLLVTQFSGTGTHCTSVSS